MVAVWLMYLTVFLSSVFLVFDIVTIGAVYNIAPIEYLPDTITIAVIAVLAYFIASGRRLARLIYIVSIFVMYILVFSPFYLSGFSNITIFNIPIFITAFIHLLAIIFLITPSANAWFKRENKNTAEPHDGKPI